MTFASLTILLVLSLAFLTCRGAIYERFSDLPAKHFDFVIVGGKQPSSRLRVFYLTPRSPSSLRWNCRKHRCQSLDRASPVLGPGDRSRRLVCVLDLKCIQTLSLIRGFTGIRAFWTPLYQRSALQLHQTLHGIGIIPLRLRW